MTIGKKRRKVGDFLVWAGVALVANTLVLTLSEIVIALYVGTESLFDYFIASTYFFGIAPAAWSSAALGSLLCIVGMFVRWKVRLPMLGFGIALGWFLLRGALYFVPPPAIAWEEYLEVEEELNRSRDGGPG